MLKNVATLTVSNLVVQIVTVAAYPILTYLFSPAAFGLFGVVTSISLVVSVFVCLRMDTLLQIEDAQYEIPLAQFAERSRSGPSGSERQDHSIGQPTVSVSGIV